nr:growth arrest and DNA damage-inducible proteins-interacting protein 1 [Onthophagus taurus]
MIRHTILFKNVLQTKAPLRLIRLSSNTVNIEDLEKETALSPVLDEEVAQREAELERKRDKSRLNPAHRNMLHDRKPYNEEVHWSHNTLNYHRKMYGRYGASSGVNPAYCWPIKSELIDTKEYERVKYPMSLKEMIETSKKLRVEKEEKILKRQKEISTKMLKLDGWIKDLQIKVAKRESEAKAAKERKDKLIEEVRRHFGYTVDPRDERFKEMLVKKEKEQKKQMKEAKKKVKEAKYVERLIVGEKEKLDTKTGVDEK